MPDFKKSKDLFIVIYVTASDGHIAGSYTTKAEKQYELGFKGYFEKKRINSLSFSLCKYKFLLARGRDMICVFPSKDKLKRSVQDEQTAVILSHLQSLLLAFIIVIICFGSDSFQR